VVDADGGDERLSPLKLYERRMNSGDDVIEGASVRDFP
jgi:hypothetical protein